MGDEHIYLDTSGMRCRVEPGVLDANARHLFMNGQCHALAAAVARRQGWQVAMVCIYSGEDDTEYIESPHALVALPDGRYADADGIHDGDFIEKGYADDYTVAYLEEMDPDDMLERLPTEPTSWQPANMALAEQFVDALLVQWGLGRPELDGVHTPPAPTPNAVEQPAPAAELGR